MIKRIDKLIGLISTRQAGRVTYTDTQGGKRNISIGLLALACCGGTDWNLLGLPAGGTDEIRQLMKQYAPEVKLCAIAVQMFSREGLTD